MAERDSRSVTPPSKIPDLAERALSALGRRVVLSGPVLPSGGVEVRDLRVLPREENLPPTEEAEGILSSG